MNCSRMPERRWTRMIDARKGDWSAVANELSCIVVTDVVGLFEVLRTMIWKVEVFDGACHGPHLWNQQWPLIRDAPQLAIGGAILIALAVWALVSWSYRRKIARIKGRERRLGSQVRLRTREGSSGFRKTQRVGGHGSASQQTDHRERNDTGNRRYNAKGYDGTRELASANSALSKALTS